MNNNRGNNRRRGRGNNRPQGGGGGGGGGQLVNRIDSRARGNAPQLLEKFRKLAQDAHQNGDRVLAEYYLQFADHYFRVIADSRTRQEEQRNRRDERWPEPGEEGEEVGEFAVESDFAFDQPVYTRREPREDREPRQRDPRETRQTSDRETYREEPAEPRGAKPAAAAETADEAPADEARSVYEAPQNPFVRGNRGLRPRREDRRPRAVESDGSADGSGGDEGPAVFDAAVLPPSFACREESAPAAVLADGEAAPAPKRRGRKPKAAAPVEGEA